MTIDKERLSDAGFMPKWIWHEHLARYRFAQRYVKAKAVVDCASGAGIGSRMFAEAGARSVQAFDVSEEAVRRAAQDFQMPNLRFQTGSALQLPLPDRSAEVYISLETLEHIEQDRACLNEVRRVLAPSGTYICSTPNRRITNPGKKLSDKPWNRFHVREYDEGEFARLLASGFETVEFFGQNPNVSVKAGMLEACGKLLPWHGAVRLNQFLKLPALLWDREENHAVVKADLPQRFEYLVAVCSGPRAHFEVNPAC